MRVAVRRLRSALSVFNPIAQGADLAIARTQLRHLATTLGPARDWDVFTAETAPSLVRAVPNDSKVAALVAAAERRRAAAHSALRAWLTGPEWRAMALDLALLAALRPWERTTAAEQLHGSAAAFATRSLARRTRRMLQAGTDLAALSADDRHELRKQGKKMRYTAEFFAPCFPAKPTRRFLGHLAELQDELGRANDAATARGLIAQLGGSHAYAAGVVVGYLAGSAGRGHRRINQAWARFSDTAPFWS
jgi:CHAD domain-containing protein